MIKKNLEGCLESGRWLEVYTKPDKPDTFSVGRVLALDDTFALMGMVHPSGSYDGYGLILLDAIYRICWETRHIRRLEAYMEEAGSPLSFLTLPEEGETLVEKLLVLAGREGWITTLELHGSGYDDVEGFVEKIENGSAIMDQRTEYGSQDGRSVVQLEAVSHVFCDDDRQRRLRCLSHRFDRGERIE